MFRLSSIVVFSLFLFCVGCAQHSAVKIIDDIFTYHERYSFDDFAAESVQFQEYFATSAPAPAGMVLVEGGSFTMGSDDITVDEMPRHEVTVSSFYIGVYEITQAEWEAVMGDNPSHYGGENMPVENVSWFDALEYCNERSLQEGLTPVYSFDGDDVIADWQANGYRLPTEAEWEYAAYKGDRFDGWWEENSGGTTHPVGSREPNKLGLYDMSGNVWEWVWDWFGNYSRDKQTDPTGARSGEYRIVRGGSWYADDPAVLLAAYRGMDYPANSDDSMGFRVARRADAQ